MAQTVKKKLQVFMNNVKEYEQLVNNQKETKKEASTRRYTGKGEKKYNKERKEGIELKGFIC